MSLRDTLASKRRREVRHEVLVGDADAAEEVTQQLEAALQVLAKADTAVKVLDEGTERHKQAQLDRLAQRELVDRLRAERAEHFHVLMFAPLPPADWDALKAAHAENPSEGIAYNRDTLRVPLIAASVVDSDLSEADWAAELESGRWSAAERDQLYNAAIAAQMTVPDLSAGKGYSGTPSTLAGWRTAARTVSRSRAS